MKKFLSLFLSIVTITTMLSFAIPAQAADTIQSGQSVDVVLSGSNNQKKEFVYTMPANGYFYYKLTPKYRHRVWEDSSSDTGYSEEYSTSFWAETYLEYNYKQYVDQIVWYGDNWQSPKFAFKQGSKIKITVDDPFCDDETTVCYNVTVYFVKVNNFEKESNNSKKSATKFNLKKTYTGNVVENDVDYWVFTVPKTGKYKFSGVCYEGNYNYFYFYKGSKQMQYLWASEGDGYGTIYKGKLKKGQKVYIKIEGQNGNMYKLKVKKL